MKLMDYVCGTLWTSPFSCFGGLSSKTGGSGESGREEGQAVEWRDATLLLMLSSVSRISQWSDIEELVEPGRRMGGRERWRLRGRAE